MNTRLLVSLLLPLLTILFTSAVHAAESLRTWTDSTGKQQMQAQLLKTDGEKVVLRLKNKRTVTIAIDKLSDKDQRYLERRKAQAKKSEDPAPDATEEKAPAGEATTEAAPEVKRRKKAKPAVAAPAEPAWAKIKKLSSVENTEKWPLSITPLELHDRSPVTDHLVNFAEPVEQKDRLQEHVGISPSGSFFACSFLRDRKFGEKPDSLVVTCELPSGQQSGAYLSGAPYRVLAISDDGSRIALALLSQPFEELIEVWALAKSEHKVIGTWPPGMPGGEKERIAWAALVGNERLLTLSNEHRLVSWNLAAGKPDWYLPKLCETAALSPDKRFVACGASGRVLLVDLESNQIAAELTTHGERVPFCCFSRDGAHLASGNWESLQLWNLVDGTLERELAGPNLPLGSRLLLWPEDRYLLMENCVADLELQTRDWSYGFGGPWAGCDRFIAAAIRGDHRQTAQAGNLGALAVVAVPSPLMAAKLKAALAAPDYLAFKSGGTVKLNVDRIPDGPERKQAEALLTEKLTAMACKVVPTAPVEMVVSTELRRSSQQVRLPAFAGGTQTVQFQHYCVRLEILFQGKRLWAKENAKQIANEATNEKLDPQLFDGIALPKQLVNPAFEGGVGASSVTANGITESNPPTIVHLAPGQKFP